MNKVALILIVSFIFVLAGVFTNVFAENPVIKESEVAKTYLFLSKRAGSIDGYLIFYDKEGRQCSVDGSVFTARLYCGWSSAPDFKKEFNITPDDFSIIRTKGSDVFYGYVITPFIVKRGWRKKGDWEDVTVKFEWGDLKASTTVSRYLR